MVPPISMEQRRLLLASTSILKTLGHSGFDRVLLEFGVPEDVGSGSGLMARANSLARYALANPNSKVAQGSLLTTEIIRRAQELFGTGAFANVTDPERTEYQMALAAFQTNEADTTSISSPKKFGVQNYVTDVGSQSVAIQDSFGSPSRPKARRKVFVVHGHDEGARESVARFLAKIDFEPIILHERPNRGRAIITKFQQEAADVGFAVVLMTPDDFGGRAGDTSNPRARQNVVFELGFFIGILGPERVAALVKGQVEQPSDFEGVVYIPLDNSAWKQKLAQELEAAGFEIDWKKAGT
jgi:predicted nucleotide-binding protein